MEKINFIPNQETLNAALGITEERNTEFNTALQTLVDGWNTDGKGRNPSEVLAEFLGIALTPNEQIYAAFQAGATMATSTSGTGDPLAALMAIAGSDEDSSSSDDDQNNDSEL